MAKAAPKRSRRSKKAAAARKRGSKRTAKRTKKATRARKTAAVPAARPKPPALERERRTLTEEPVPAAVPGTPTSAEPRTIGDGSSGETGATDGAEGEGFD